MKLLHGAALAAAAFLGAPAMATVNIYGDQASFDVATLHQQNWGFFFYDAQPLGSSYQWGPATFDVAPPGMLVGYYDGLPAPFIDDGGGFTMTITTSFAALGLELASYFGPQTISYTIGSLSGTFDLGDTPGFIGFGSLEGPATLTLSHAQELDVLGFEVADVPEPSSWAMAICGFGIVGMTMRRRRRSAALGAHAMAG